MCHYCYIMPHDARFNMSSELNKHFPDFIAVLCFGIDWW